LRAPLEGRPSGGIIFSTVQKFSPEKDEDAFPRLIPHIYSANTRKLLEKRFKNPKDPLKIVIVRDMWLTGFDVPCLRTMYIDKPMRDHNLMQAIARVDRVFRDKKAGWWSTTSPSPRSCAARSRPTRKAEARVSRRWIRAGRWRS
jgi:type I site-specific restriction-modification system R (restriction) subunit